MEHTYCVRFENVLLRPLHRYDIEYLRQWRNQPELNRFLTAVGQVTEIMQEKWFRTYLSDPDVIFFAVDYRRYRTVGAIALYGFDGKTCQIGKVIIGEKEAQGQGQESRSEERFSRTPAGLQSFLDGCNGWSGIFRNQKILSIGS